MADNWRLGAKCRSLNSTLSDKLFFPKSGRAINEAKKFCTEGEGTCQVAEQCLEFALEHDARGIWAGTTYKERKAILDFRIQLNGPRPINPRSTKKVKRSGFKMA